MWVSQCVVYYTQMILRSNEQGRSSHKEQPWTCVPSSAYPYVSASAQILATKATDHQSKACCFDFPTKLGFILFHSNHYSLLTSLNISLQSTQPTMRKSPTPQWRHRETLTHTPLTDKQYNNGLYHYHHTAIPFLDAEVITRPGLRMVRCIYSNVSFY